MNENKSTIDKLIQLSKIFKEGFTVEVKNDNIQQYNNANKPYVLSYKTIITIDKNRLATTYNRLILYKSFNNCIIGGWLDSDTNIYYIELNKAYKNKSYALKMAKKYNQKAIYDYERGVVIKV